MRWPAEWEPHDAVWIGFPGDPVEWPVGLAEAQKEAVSFANTVNAGGAGEKVLLVCRSEQDAVVARQWAESNVEILVEGFGDIWLRDTAAIMTIDEKTRIANLFGFNGWGGKFQMAGDEDIGSRLARRHDFEVRWDDTVLEGGAIDGDGTGWLLTTEQCVLNTNRNNQADKAKLQKKFHTAFGCTNICWLGEGLINDHTDGHVDNLARFVAPRTLVIPKADREDDPNAETFEDAVCRAKRDNLNVLRLPSVGKLTLDGKIAPASYMNFYVGNRVVVVPQYEASNDSRVLEEMEKLFPDRKIIGLSSKALLRGGGSFHCISQQIPKITRE